MAMRLNWKILILVIGMLAVGSLFLSPSPSFLPVAESYIPPDHNPPADGNPPGGGIKNPLKFQTLQQVLGAIAGFLFTLAIPLVTVMVLIGGLQILTAAGSSEQINKGKRTLLYAVIGFVAILIAGGIASIVSNILS